MLYFRQKTAQVCGNFPKINYIGFWPLCQLSERQLLVPTALLCRFFRPGKRRGEFRFRLLDFEPTGRARRQVSIVEK